MPRVADIYSRPAGIDAVPNATIESADYNANVADVEADLNLPRPIVAGGTGASNAAGARTNLKAEISGAQVTNYDSHVFENGSFFSYSGATGEPLAGRHFTGVATILGGPANDYVTLTVRDTTVGKTYFRLKQAGVWQAWTATDADYVNVTGDTMTGSLAINKLAPQIDLNMTAVNGGAIFSSSFGGLPRWRMFLGTGAAETGGNAGSDFLLQSCNDAGAAIASTLSIARATSAATFSGDLQTNGVSRASVGNIIGVAGTSTIVPELLMRGSAGVGVHGAIQKWSKNDTIKWWHGFQSSIMGDGSDNYMFYNAATAYTVAIDAATGTLSVRCATTLPALAAGIKCSYTGGGTQYGLGLRAAVDGTQAVVFTNSADTIVGTISETNTNVSFNTSSDERLKEDLKSFDAGNIIDDTNVYDFAWKSTGERAYGVIGQQAIEVYPTAVTYLEKEDWYGVDYSKYVPVLLQELKALRARVAELEGRVGVGVQPA